MSDLDSQEENEEENWMDTNWGDPDENGQNMVFHPESKSLKSNCLGSLGPIKMGQNQPATEKGQNSEGQGDRVQEGGSGLMNRMRLNDNKAGMDGLDKEKINQIILEASKGAKQVEITGLEDERQITALLSCTMSGDLLPPQLPYQGNITLTRSRFYENERKKEQQMNKRIEEQKIKLQQITEIQLKQGQIEADKLLVELESGRNLNKTIVHIDMDAFYAAVEMKDNPSLKDKPMAVGGMSMLSTSNYHARKFGVRAAMPGFIGKKLCSELIIVPTNFDRYTEVSKQVREVLADYDPNFSPMSLDEAYLDFTEHFEKRFLLSDYERTFLCRKTDGCSKSLCNCDLNLKLKPIVLHCETNGRINFNNRNNPNDDQDESEYTTCPLCGRPYPEYDLVTFGMSPDDAVNEMRTRIEQKTCLTASAGIAPNTMLAKVCSDKNKPNGQYRILPERDKIMEFITTLPTRKISGIGKVSETMLNALGVYTCNDLYNQRALLYHLYSQISFNYFMRICIGIGSTFVERDGERKSMSTERTFSEISKPSELYSKCEELSTALSEDLKDGELKGKTVAIKIKTVKFEVKTRAHTLTDYTNESDVIYGAAKELLKTEIQAVSPQPLRLRLMGVRMSSLLHQKLCKKKQNTITGFMRRKGSEKVKQNQDLDKSCDSHMTKQCETESKMFKQASEISCDNQITDLQENENRHPVDHNVENYQRKSVLSCEDEMTEILKTGNKITENNNSSDSECDNEREVDVDISLVKCREIEGKCSVQKVGDDRKDDKIVNVDDIKLKRTYDLIKKIKTEISNVQATKGSVSTAEGMQMNASTEIEKDIGSCDVNLKSDDEQEVSDSVNVESDNYVCPVCQNLVECTDLVTFNRHIDICLNKNLVKVCTKIAHEEDRNFKKFVSSPKASKKAKSSQKTKGKKKAKPFAPISSSLVSKFCKQKVDTGDKEEVQSSQTKMNDIQENSLKDGCVIHIDDDFNGDSFDAKIIEKSENDEIEIAKNKILLKENKRNTKTEKFRNNKGTSNDVNDISGIEKTDMLTSVDNTEMIDTLNSSRSLVCPVCFMEQKGNDLDNFNEHVDTCLSKDTITEIVKIENNSTTKSQKRNVESAAEKQGKKRQKTNSGIRTIDSFFNKN